MNFPLGLVIGIVVTLILCAVFDWGWLSPDSATFPSVLSGLFVLFASFIATTGVLCTIENSRELADETRERKLTAARAALALALSELSDLCERYVTYIANGCLDFKGDKILSETSHQTIQLVIEYADPDAQERLANLMQFYQVALTRSKDVENMKVDWAIEDEQLLLKMNAANRIADWIAIRSLAVEFYGYSRIDQRLGDRKDSYANFERELGLLGATEYGYWKVTKFFMTHLPEESMKKRGMGFLIRIILIGKVKTNGSRFLLIYINTLSTVAGQII